MLKWMMGNGKIVWVRSLVFRMPQFRVNIYFLLNYCLIMDSNPARIFFKARK